MEKIIIFGTGDIAEVAHLYLSEDSKYEVVAFTEDASYIKAKNFLSLPIVPFEQIEESYPPNNFKMFIPLSYSGINKLRKDKYLKAKKKGYSFISYVSSAASIASNVKVGENCFIFEDNTIQPFVEIGNNTILWSGNHIGHHSIIEDNCFIASHVVISGRCVIGDSTFIGVNATLRDHLTIGRENVIGAGAIILNNTKDKEVYAEKNTRLAAITSDKLRGI